MTLTSHNLIKSRSLLSYEILFIGILIFYILTMPPNVTFEDTGTFAAACYSFGYAHPPGYPFYFFLCYPITNIITLFGGNPALGAGISSAIFATLASCLLAWFINRQFNKKYFGHSFAVLLALNSIVILQAQIPEIYTLNLLITFISLLLAENYRRTKNPNYILSLALVTGLGLATHWPLYVLMYPVVLFWLIPVFKNILQDLLKIKILILSILLFLLGLSPYLHILITSSEAYVYLPVNSWSELIAYIRRDYYSDEIFESYDFSFAYLFELNAILLSDISRSLYYVLIIPLIIGYYYLYKKSKTKFLAVLWGSLASTLFLLNFRPLPITNDLLRLAFLSYLLPAMMFFIYTIAYGLINITNRFKIKYYEFYQLGVASLIAVIHGFYFHNRSNDDMAYILAKAILDSTKANATYFDTSGDKLFPIRYLNHVAYQDKNIQFVKFSIEKFEELSKDPKNIVYHDIVSKFRDQNFTFMGLHFEQNIIPGQENVLKVIINDDTFATIHKMIDFYENERFMSETTKHRLEQLIKRVYVGYYQMHYVHGLSFKDKDLELFERLEDTAIGKYTLFSNHTIYKKDRNISETVAIFKDAEDRLEEVSVNMRAYAYYLLGKEYKRANDLKNAEISLRRALEIYPSSLNYKTIDELHGILKISRNFVDFAYLDRKYKKLSEDEIQKRFNE